MAYSQRDPLWANQRLGTADGVTIGSDGCFVTAQAQTATHFGHQITPAQLDDIYTNNNWYINKCWNSAINLSRAFPDINLVYNNFYTDVPADLSALHSEADEDVLVGLDWDHRPENGVQWHFVRVVSSDGDANGDFIIDDPEGGFERPFNVRFGNNPAQTIQQIIKYKKQGFGQPAPAPVPDPVPTPAPVEVAPQAASEPVIVPVTPEWESTWHERVYDATTTRDAYAVDMTAAEAPIQVKAGSLVHVGGTFDADGKQYVRTTWSVANNKWYGLPVEAFEPPTIEIPVVHEEPTPPAPTSQEEPGSDDKLNVISDTMLKLFHLLAILVSPVIKLLGRKNQ